MRGENVGAMGDGRGVVGRPCRGAWVGVVLAVALWFSTATGSANPPAHQQMIEDGGSGSTACINVVTYRYYLCVRADGSVYRIYY